MPRKPRGVDFPGSVVGIGTVEKNDALRERAVTQQPKEIVLGAPGFGEDDRLLRAAELGGLAERNIERLQQRLALCVVVNRGREAREPVQIGDLPLDGGAVTFG